MKSWWRIGLVSVLSVALLMVVGVTQQEIKNPNTFISATIGDLETLDPAWHYDTASATAIHNIYEPLIWYEREKIDVFVPALATEVPVPERLPDGGMRIVFKIRQGVKFHEGGDLTPSDMAYSLQRALLQDRSGGPIWLLLEPILGVSAIEELAEEVGDLAACEKVQEAVQADDENWTFTLTMKEAFAPILQILAGTWGAVLDKEWVIAQGGWDGTCENWRQWHDPAAEASELFNKANGTGPYKLEAWIPGEEIRFTRNDNYWRGYDNCAELYNVDDCWGLAEMESAVIKVVEEFGTRLAMFEAGDADFIYVPRAVVAQMDPLVEAGRARLYKDLPGVISQDAFFNFQVAEGSPFMPLLGGEAKADLLSDIHMRRALNYCFNTERYIDEAWLGEAERRRGPIISGLLGFNPDQPVYEFDMGKCEEELKLAFGGTLEKPGPAWTKPLRLVLTYNTGNLQRKIAAELLERNLESLNEKRDVRSLISIEVLDLPWPTYLKNMDAKRLSVFWVGWLEDYHHPHNWVQPFMHRRGAFAGNQNFQVIGPTKSIYDDFKIGEPYLVPILPPLPPEEFGCFPPDIHRPVNVEDPWELAKDLNQNGWICDDGEWPTLQDMFDNMIEKARMEADLETARIRYYVLQDWAIEWAIDLFQAQLLDRHYEQPYDAGWFFNPAYPGPYFFWYWKGQACQCEENIPPTEVKLGADQKLILGPAWRIWVLNSGPGVVVLTCNGATTMLPPGQSTEFSRCENTGKSLTCVVHALKDTKVTYSLVKCDAWSKKKGLCCVKVR